MGDVLNKKIDKIPLPALIILFLLGLSSCQQTTVTNTATADVFIKTIINQGDTLFGTAHSLVSFNRIASAAVKTPKGDSIPITGTTDGGISVYKDPSLERGDYKKVLPLAGIYTYDVTFKDKTTQVVTNTLGTDYVLPPVINSLVKSADGQSVVLDWSSVQGAQLYQIRITSGNNEVIPATLYSPTGVLEVQFPITSFSRYMPGTFTVELDALLFESADFRLLQAMGTSNGTITLP